MKLPNVELRTQRVIISANEVMLLFCLFVCLLAGWRKKLLSRFFTEFGRKLEHGSWKKPY